MILIWCYVVGMHSLFKIIILWLTNYEESSVCVFVICILNQYKYYNQYTVIYAGYIITMFIFYVCLTIYKYLAAAWTDNLRKVFNTIKLN